MAEKDSWRPSSSELWTRTRVQQIWNWRSRTSWLWTPVPTIQAVDGEARIIISTAKGDRIRFWHFWQLVLSQETHVLVTQIAETRVLRRWGVFIKWKHKALQRSDRGTSFRAYVVESYWAKRKTAAFQAAAHQTWSEICDRCRCKRLH